MWPCLSGLSRQSLFRSPGMTIVPGLGRTSPLSFVGLLDVFIVGCASRPTLNNPELGQEKAADLRLVSRVGGQGFVRSKSLLGGDLEELQSSPRVSKSILCYQEQWKTELVVDHFHSCWTKQCPLTHGEKGTMLLCLTDSHGSSYGLYIEV